MTYEPWKKAEYLIRFEHILDKSDDPSLNQYSFNISNVFPGDFKFTEMNLAANQRIEDVNRLHFRQEGARITPQTLQVEKELSESELLITLKPMQIRTFIMSPNHGVITVAIFKLFPLLVLAMVLKHFL